MEAAIEKMEAQLELWRTRIDTLSTRTQNASSRFEDLIYVDELKALHAIAQLKLDEFRRAESTERILLKADLKQAWKELDTALTNPNA